MQIWQQATASATSRRFRGGSTPLAFLFIIVVVFVKRQALILHKSTHLGPFWELLDERGRIDSTIDNGLSVNSFVSPTQLENTPPDTYKRESHHQHVNVSSLNGTNSMSSPTTSYKSLPIRVCIPIRSRETVEFTHYPTTYKLSDFISPIYIPATSSAAEDRIVVDKYNVTITDASHAICEFVIKGGSFHFPHGMQQLYRCFSYWQFERQQQKQQQQEQNSHILQKGVSHKNATESESTKKGLVLIWHKSPRARSIYLEGMRKLFRDVFDVTEIKKLGPPLPLERLSSASLSETKKNQMATKKPPATLVVQARWHPGIERHRDEGFQMRSMLDPALIRDATAEYYHWHSNRTAKNNIRSGCPSAWSSPAANLNTSASLVDSGVNMGINKTHPIIGILDRSKQRRITNIVELQSSLQAEFKDTPTKVIQVAYMENKTFLQQIEWMNSVDILITSHGAALASIPFMPHCGGILEYFPTSYYYPHFFGTLAGVSGLEHATLYLGQNRRVEWERTSYFNDTLRQSSRLKDICAPIEKTIQATKVMIEHWQDCCFHDPFMRSKLRQQKEQLSEFLIERHSIG